jgi:hypothetical protein
MLILITVVLIAYLLTIQIRIGVPYWDVFNYLNNALFFAGMNGGGVTTYLPPLIPFLTSLIFRMGYVSIDSIFVVTGLVSIIGVVGLYLLLKERFNAIQSFTGSIIFISLPVVISWVVSGGIDIPGVVFSIWTIYFMIVGLKRDSRFLYFVLPLFIISFLARFTAGLIILPVFLYFLMNLNDFKQIEDKKKIVTGIIIELGVLGALTLIFFVKLGATGSIYNLLFSIVTSSSGGTTDVAYNPNILYYLQNLLNYISVGPLMGTYQQIMNPSQGNPTILSYIIGFIVLIGLSSYIGKGITSRFKKTDESSINFNNMVKITIMIVLIISLIISFYYSSFIFCEILLFALLYISYRFLNNRTDQHHPPKLSFDFMFLAWFGSYLIFHGILPFKVDRYFITMAPALVYFIILGFSEFMNLIEPRIKSVKHTNFRTGVVYLIIALIFLSSATATYVGHTPKKTFTVDIGYSSDWIKEYDHDYQNKIISSDYPNAVSWHLKKEILGGFPRFFNNQDDFAEFLQKNGVDYYIDSTSTPHPDLKGYHIIKSFGVVAIYERV